jgi:hypothetical protein
MTEAEWLASESSSTLLNLMPLQPSERKMRLFGCACFRRIWELLPDARSRDAVEVIERFADGKATESELQGAEATAEGAFRDRCNEAGGPANGGDDSPHARSALGVWVATGLEEDFLPPGVGNARLAMKGGTSGIALAVDDFRSEEAAQARLLRDILGNPFRPVSFSPEWRTDNAVALARQMYDSRDFSAMPILANALQDAGCDNDDILNHCRSEGPHVRGCWVVDLVLGKE